MAGFFELSIGEIISFFDLSLYPDATAPIRPISFLSVLCNFRGEINSFFVLSLYANASAPILSFLFSVFSVSLKIDCSLAKHMAGFFELSIGEIIFFDLSLIKRPQATNPTSLTPMPPPPSCLYLSSVFSVPPW